jgi:hypothetical protein
MLTVNIPVRASTAVTSAGYNVILFHELFCTEREAAQQSVSVFGLA